jgi:hypothetical protein
MELKTIAELIVLASAKGAGELTLLKAARSLLDVAIAGAGDIVEVPQLPAPKKNNRKGWRRSIDVKRERDARKASKRAERAAPAPEDAPPARAASGISVDGAVVAYNGKSITVTPRQAQVAAELVRVSPSLIGHDVLAKKIWGNTSNSSVVCATGATRELQKSLDAIGLKVTRLTGIGAGVTVL